MTVPLTRRYKPRDLMYPTSLGEFLALPLRTRNDSEHFDQLPGCVLADDTDTVTMIEDRRGNRQRLVLKDGKLYRSELPDFKRLIMEGIQKRTGGRFVGTLRTRGAP